MAFGQLCTTPDFGVVSQTQKIVDFVQRALEEVACRHTVAAGTHQHA